MSRYRIGDTVVDTDRAQMHWDEDTRWDGRNHISIPTGSQWHHEELYLSRKGRYYLVHWSNYQGSSPSAEFITREAAALWLVTNNHDLPLDLAEMSEEVME